MRRFQPPTFGFFENRADKNRSFRATPLRSSVSNQRRAKGIPTISAPIEAVALELKNREAEDLTHDKKI